MSDRRGTTVALIGPLPPHRGGIAQYGIRLHRALRERHSAVTYAFKRQYPRWLYPGASDIAPGGARVTDDGVVYRIDSLNPLSWVGTARAIGALQPTALIIQWWTVFWWPAFMTIATLARRRRVPLILLCHNVVDHETSSWKERLSAAMMRMADGFIVHSREHRDLLATRFPRHPIMQAPIPSYDDHVKATRPLPKRGRLELLFFGFLRPYKGLDVLLDALELLEDREVHLTVAGEAWSDSAATVERLRRLEGKNVELHLDFVPDDTAAELFERADAVVLPYEAASGSAVVALAYDFDTPVIASRVGGLIDAVADGETGILFSPGDSDELASLLRGLDRDRTARLAQGVARHKGSRGWAEFAESVADLAKTVAAQTRER